MCIASGRNTHPNRWKSTGGINSSEIRKDSSGINFEQKIGFDQPEWDWNVRPINWITVLLFHSHWILLVTVTSQHIYRLHSSFFLYLGSLIFTLTVCSMFQSIYALKIFKNHFKLINIKLNRMFFSLYRKYCTQSAVHMAKYRGSSYSRKTEFKPWSNILFKMKTKEKTKKSNHTKLSSNICYQSSERKVSIFCPLKWA